MNEFRYSVVLALGVTIVGAGCSVVPPDRSFGRVQQPVAERIGAEPAWPTSPGARDAIGGRVRELLGEPLTQERAVRIALLNNRTLWAEYSDLGMQEADFEEAGLLENPSLAFGLGFPDRPPSITELDFGLTMNLLRAMLTPARRDIAGDFLDAAVLRAADRVLQTVTETRLAYLDLQASEHMSAVLREIAVAAEASAELAKRLFDAGNMSELALANEQALYEDARIEYARSLAESKGYRERLNVLMGLWGQETGWSIVDRLPELPPSEPDLGSLESYAVRQRLDLAAAAKEVEALSKAAGLQRDWRLLLTTEVGVRAARDTDGQWVVGPEFTLDLPIFNQRQAEITRLDSALLGARARLEAIAIETRADVRRLRDHLFAMRYEIEHYRDTVLPLRERITALTLEQYNFMFVDTFGLLAAKRDEIAVYRSYLESIHDYWATRAELERAVGGRLPMASGMSDEHPAEMEGMPAMPSMTEPQHQHHGEH